MRSTLDQEVQVRALAGDIMLCSWARHFTLTAPIFNQKYMAFSAKIVLGRVKAYATMSKSIMGSVFISVT